MQTLITVLFILAIIAFPLQLSLLKRKYIIYGWLILTGCFIWFMHTRAIEQSYSRFQEQLSDTDLVGNLLVLQIIESIGGMLLSIFLIRLHYNERVKKNFHLLVYFPGIIVLPALFYLESYMFLNIPGIPFKVLAAILAISIPLLLLLVLYFLKQMVEEFDLRLEIKFMVHLFQLLLAVIISITLFRLPTSATKTAFPAGPVAVFLGCVIAGLFIGRIIYHYRFNKIKKRLL